MIRVLSKEAHSLSGLVELIENSGSLSFLEHCEPNPCQNGGTCNEIKEGYECICSSGFKGSDCEGKEDKQLNVIVCSQRAKTLITYVQQTT